MRTQTNADVLTEKRVAIYTRQSDEESDVQVPSCPAQRERAHLYILSQQEKKWVEIEKKYDDPDYSGKDLNRPGIRELIRDIEQNLVDVVVVYCMCDRHRDHIVNESFAHKLHNQV